jgi:hypothetical protein
MKNEMKFIFKKIELEEKMTPRAGSKILTTAAYHENPSRKKTDTIYCMYEFRN